MRTADPDAPRRRRILDAAECLMMAKGYAATSVGDICRAARVTNGSFFHFFKDKEALGLAAAERFLDRELEHVERAPFRRSADPRARLLGWIDGAVAAFEDPDLPKSCLLGNLTQELAPSHPAFQALSARLFERWGRGITEDARAAGLPDPDGVAELFLAVLQGSLVLIKGKRDAGIGARNMRHLRRYLEGLAKQGGRS